MNPELVRDANQQIPRSRVLAGDFPCFAPAIQFLLLCKPANDIETGLALAVLYGLQNALGNDEFGARLGLQRRQQTVDQNGTTGFVEQNAVVGDDLALYRKSVFDAHTIPFHPR